MFDYKPSFFKQCMEFWAALLVSLVYNSTMYYGSSAHCIKVRVTSCCSGSRYCRSGFLILMGVLNIAAANITEIRREGGVGSMGVGPCTPLTIWVVIVWFGITWISTTWVVVTKIRLFAVAIGVVSSRIVGTWNVASFIAISRIASCVTVLITTLQ